MTFLVQPTLCTVQPGQALFPESLTSSVQQPPTNTWCNAKRVTCHCCPSSIVIKILSLVSRSHARFTVCAADTSEHEWVTHFSVPLICSYTLFFHIHWQCEWRGAGFSQGDSLKLKVQTPTGASECAGTHSHSAFVTMNWGSQKANLSSQKANFKPEKKA